MWKCRSCHSENEDTYRFCLNCGAERPKAAAPQEGGAPRPVKANPVPARKKANATATVLLLILSLLLVLAVIGVLIVYPILSEKAADKREETIENNRGNRRDTVTPEPDDGTVIIGGDDSSPVVATPDTNYPDVPVLVPVSSPLPTETPAATVPPQPTPGSPLPPSVTPPPQDYAPYITFTPTPTAVPTPEPLPIVTPAPEPVIIIGSPEPVMPTASPVPADAYLLPESNTRLMTDADLQNLTWEQCTFARNEIYARHGRIFVTKEIADYFNSKSWYHGTVQPENFSESVFNDFERANIEFIRQYEIAHWGRSYY